MQPSRALITFAFVADEFTKTGDITRGLLPLFAPLINKRAGQPFEPAKFASDVSTAYGLTFHPYVAEALAPRLADAGYLAVTSITNGSASYVNSALPESGTAFDDGLLDKIVQDYMTHARTLLSTTRINIDDNTLEQAFFARLRDPEFLSIVSKPQRSFKRTHTLTLRKKREADHVIDQEDHLDFIVADFIGYLASADQDKFHVVMQIANGALLSEIVLALREPPTTGNEFDGVTVFLDGPIVLDVLDLSDRANTAYAKELFSQLRRTKARICTFPHVLDEVRGAIKAPLENYNRRVEVFGPLGRRLLTTPKHATYAAAILADLRSAVEAEGIEIIEPTHSEYVAGLSKFNDRQQRSLENNVGIYGTPEARERDAKSIANVLRLRVDTPPQMNLTRVNAVFVTRNVMLAENAGKFLLREQVIEAEEVPPCITDRYLAGILWITLGGQTNELSAKRLLANCVRATSPRLDVVSKIAQFLEDLDPQKAKYFEALMTDERAAHFLMQRTLGDPRVVTRENYLDIYEEVRRTTAADVTREKDREIDSLKEEQRNLVSRLEAQHGQETILLRRKIEALESDLNRISEERQQLESANQEFEQTKDDFAAYKFEQDKRLMRQAIRRGKRAERRARTSWGVLIIVVDIAVALLGRAASQHYAPSEYVSLGLIVLSLLLAATDNIPVLSAAKMRWLVRQRDRAFKKAVEDLSLDDIERRYQVDWEAGETAPLPTASGPVLAS